MAENLRKSVYLIPDDREEARGVVKEVFKQAIKMLGGKPRFKCGISRPYSLLKIMTGKSFRNEVGTDASNVDVDLVIEEITEQPDQTIGFYNYKRTERFVFHTDKGGFLLEEKWEEPKSQAVEHSEPNKKSLENLLERLRSAISINQEKEPVGEGAARK